MNKQAFTFLTLFTLVLMLAVYYVTLPLDDPSVNTDNLIVSQPDQGSTISSYQTDLQSKHEGEVNDNEDVLANKDSSTEDKLNALANINATQQRSTLETKIQQELSEVSFQGCFVEIEDEVTRVVCPIEYIGKENATSILSVVYQTISTDDLVEVSFE